MTYDNIPNQVLNMKTIVELAHAVFLYRIAPNFRGTKFRENTLNLQNY